MMTQNDRPQSVLGTFLSGTLGIVSIFFLALTIIPFAPILVFIASIIYLAWIFISPVLKKQNQEASLKIKDEQ